MQPQLVHLNHPYQDALILGGIAIILMITFLLMGGPAYTDDEVRQVANQSDTVTAFLDDHPDAEATVVHSSASRYTVQYTAPGVTLTVTVDMEERHVIRTQRESVN